MATSIIPEKQTEIQQEAAFVDSFSTRLEKGEVGVDRGRVKLEREAAGDPPAKPAAEAEGKTTPDGAEDTAAAGTSSETGKSGEPANASDETEGAKSDTTDTGKEPAEGEGEAKPDAEKPKEGEKEDEDEPEETELAKEARAELAKYGLTVKLEDLPKEAQAIVKTKLSNMEAAFSRAMMDARSYRKEEAPLKAELQFLRDNKALAIVELIQQHPELEEEINTLLTEATTDTGKKALEITTRDKRASVLKGIEDQAAAVERVEQRADAISTYVKTACTKLNLPLDIVVAAVVNRLNEKPEDKRDLTDEEIDAIIGRQQLILKRHMGERTAKTRKEEIQGRKEDRKTTSPAAKATPSAGVTPVAKPAPKTDEEFVEQFVARAGR